MNENVHQVNIQAVVQEFMGDVYVHSLSPQSNPGKQAFYAHFTDENIKAQME